MWLLFYLSHYKRASCYENYVFIIMAAMRPYIRLFCGRGRGFSLITPKPIVRRKNVCMVKSQVSPVLSTGKNLVTIARVEGEVCFFVCLCVTFRLRQHIGMTQSLAIDQTTFSENDFYWRSARTISGPPGSRDMGTADPQSSPIGLYNGALIFMTMHINEVRSVDFYAL